MLATQGSPETMVSQVLEKEVFTVTFAPPNKKMAFLSEPRPSRHLNWITPTEISVHLVGIYLMNKWFLRQPHLNGLHTIIGILGITANVFGAYADLRSFLFWKKVSIQRLEYDIWSDVTVTFLVVIPTAISTVYATYFAAMNNDAISTKFKCILYLYFVVESAFSLTILSIAGNDEFQLLQFCHHLILLGYLCMLSEAIGRKQKQVHLMKIK